MRNYVINALAYDGMVRIYAARTTHMVEKARIIHDTWPTATAALGRFMTASIMMSMMHDPEDRITLNITGDGPIEKMTVDTNHNTLRADIIQPHVYLVYEDGPNKMKLNVGSAVGEGYLHVTKQLANFKPFNSSIRLQSGEIGDDFTFYYTVSEQTPSSCGLGVLVNPDNSVKLAAGFIIQVMPGCSDDIITKLEENIKKIGSVTSFLSKHTMNTLINTLSNNTAKILDKSPVRYHCGCSKDKFATQLASLSIDALEELKDDEKIEIVCHYCKSKYYFTNKDLEKIISKKRLIT